METLNDSQYSMICGTTLLLCSSKFPREILDKMKNQIRYMLLQQHNTYCFPLCISMHFPIFTKSGVKYLENWYSTKLFLQQFKCLFPFWSLIKQNQSFS